MAQSGFTPISLYFSATGAAVPSAGNLVAGELALNTNDGKLYFKNSSGVVTLLAGSTSGPAGGSTTQVQYNNSGVLAGITGATTNGTALTLVAPVLGTPASATLTNATGLPISTGVSGLGTNVATALGVNVGTAGAFVVNGGALGSPSSAGTMPAFTLGGTVSGGGNQINNVVIGTTTPLAGAFTTLSATSNVTVNSTGGTIGVYVGPSGVEASFVYNTNGNLDITPRSGFTTKITAGGLAVTGTLSATGTLSGGTSGTGYSFSGSAPATSLTLDSSGNLGIGTSSPLSRLETTGSGAGTLGLVSTAALRIKPSQTGSTDQIVFGYAESGGYSSGVIGYVPTDTAGYQKGDIFFATRDATTNTAPTERMRILTGGQLCIGKSTTAFGTNGIYFNQIGQGLFTYQNSEDVGGAAIYINRRTFDGAVMLFYKDASEVGSISVTTTLTAYNTSSDYRLKNTIAPITGALAKVALLKPVTYKWNADGSDCEGFIAHELAEVVPHAVTGAKDAVDADGKPQYQGVDTSFLVATLTAAIQEQQALITQLTNRITTLETT